MKKIKYVSLSMVLVLTQCVFGMEPEDYCRATIINQTGSEIRLTYYKPDPECHDMHGIIREAEIVANGQSAQIIVTRRPICPPPCVYQFQNANTHQFPLGSKYNEYRGDAIKIPLTSDDTQTITLPQND